MAAAMNGWRLGDRPGWPEIGVGLATFGVVLTLVALSMGFLAPDRPLWQGVIGSFGGGIAGLGGFVATYLMQRRRPTALGIQPAARRWFGVSIGFAFLGYGLSLMILGGYAGLAERASEDPQAILHAAARGGTLPFFLAFLGGAICLLWVKNSCSVASWQMP